MGLALKRHKVLAVVAPICLLAVVALAGAWESLTTEVQVYNDSATDVLLARCEGDQRDIEAGQVRGIRTVHPCMVFAGDPGLFGHTDRYLGCLLIPKGAFEGEEIVRITSMDSSIPSDECHIRDDYRSYTMAGRFWDWLLRR